MGFRYELNDSIQINLIGRCAGQPGTFAGEHYHPFWELVLMLEGEGRHLSGETYLPVHRNSLWLIPPDTLHDFYNENCSQIDKLYIGFSFQSSAQYNRDTAFCDLTRYAQAQQIVMNLRETANKIESQPQLPAAEMCCLLELITQAVSFLFSSGTGWNYQASTQINLANNIKSYLRSNACRNIKTSELSSMFYRSSHYMGDVFKKVTGFSIKEYHNMLRMEYALRLLKESDLTITEISEKTGFDSLHYFSKKFKEYYHFSPKTMRDTVREDQDTSVPDLK